MSVRSLKTVKTGLPPCCMVEVNGRIVIGTYKLEETCREGSIEVYSPDLELISSMHTKSAILDIALNDGLIYCAHSTGYVSVWNLDEELKHVSDISLSEESVLVLQLDFSDSNKMAATLTDGTVALWDLKSQQLSWEHNHHDLEPWCVRFGNGGLWTGGDDQALCFSDLREGTRLLKLKYHDAGVTSILPISDNALWTGGYDDNLRILDLRTRRQVDSVNLGGGVWRLIPNPLQPKQILTCCMYNGLTVLEKRGDELALPAITATQTDLHQSMVYGGTWNNNTAYACSFYDLLVQKFTV